MTANAERARMEQARSGVPWHRFGPYLSDRQWGSVREDTSTSGDAWSSFPHDHARSRAYRWGEDGIGALADDKSKFAIGIALWNGRDPILKERFFGLNNSEGNHGEDVKEYWWYLDATPTHSYARMAYCYPVAEYPYLDLVNTNAARDRTQPEYELVDTKILDQGWWDVQIEHAKATPDDVLITITAQNRSVEPQTLHLLPQAWFRNTWAISRGAALTQPGAQSPGSIPTLAAHNGEASSSITLSHPLLGEGVLHVEHTPGSRLLFTNNETDHQLLGSGPNTSDYLRNGFHRLVIDGASGTVNPALTGTKAAVWHTLTVDAGATTTIRLRLVMGSTLMTDAFGEAVTEPFGEDFEQVRALRRVEADEFFAHIGSPIVEPERRSVLRQALAGMLWARQHYEFDVEQWLTERGSDPWTSPPAEHSRNIEWFHLRSDDVFSMPDSWEYPWFAAWDLAFQTSALAVVDIDLAKEQVEILLRDTALHSNGQVPAYEWNFSDTNPPVHAWAALYVFRMEVAQGRDPDRGFLERCFSRLSMNFTWWLNRKDLTGLNVFQGGFLGLDNIGVFDRSSPLPTGGFLEQADGTAWMALYAQTMLEIALELSDGNDAHADIAARFAEHFCWIASALDRIGDRNDEMWDEADQFFYDVIRLPNGTAQRLKVRSLVGLLPLAASSILEESVLARVPAVAQRIERFIAEHPGFLDRCADPTIPGIGGRHLLAVCDEKKVRALTSRLLDEDEFWSPYGIRSLSRYHADHPFEFHHEGVTWAVGYLPAESDSGMFGGNSNWRGPVWFPMNVLILRALLTLYAYHGNDLKVEMPTGSGNLVTLHEVAIELADRLCQLFLPRPDGHRPVHGGATWFGADPVVAQRVLFYEYFHGDNGAGIGASHQTGWTGIVAPLLLLVAGSHPDHVGKHGDHAMLKTLGGHVGGTSTQPS